MAVELTPEEIKYHLEASDTSFLERSRQDPIGLRD